MIVQVALGIILALFILDFIGCFIEDPLSMITGISFIYALVTGNYSYFIGSFILCMLFIAISKEEKKDDIWYP